MEKLIILKKNIKLQTLAYIVPDNKEDYVNKIIPKYSLTEGITEKIYRKLIEQVLKIFQIYHEWHNERNLKKIGNVKLVRINI